MRLKLLKYDDYQVKSSLLSFIKSFHDFAKKNKFPVARNHKYKKKDFKSLMKEDIITSHPTFLE